MISTNSLSRRSFLATAASVSLAHAAKAKKVPVGLELYSVRNELQKDLMGTVRAVAKMGYQGVEFYSPYYDWTSEYAKQVRKLLDELGIRCFSTHNGPESFAPENYAKSIELNSIIGSKIVVMAGAGQVEGIDGWKKVADRLNAASENFKSAGLAVGYHNHQGEFKEIEGKKPLEVLASSTSKDVVLQLDVGTCVEMKIDPVAWINKNPGRIRSIHMKDYSPEPGKGYEVVLGDGAAPWKKIFKAAEKAGGVDYYLVEQEGGPEPSLILVEKCLAAFKKLHG